MSIFISLGTNLGDLHVNLSTARRLLTENGVVIEKASTELHTKPWGVTDQPDFLNQVLLVRFYGEPFELLHVCQSVEKCMGKIMSGDKGYVKWAPRIIDIDILTFDELEVATSVLSLPHHSMSLPYIQILMSQVNNAS